MLGNAELRGDLEYIQAHLQVVLTETLKIMNKVDKVDEPNLRLVWKVAAATNDLLIMIEEKLG